MTRRMRGRTGDEEEGGNDNEEQEGGRDKEGQQPSRAIYRVCSFTCLFLYKYLSMYLGITPREGWSPLGIYISYMNLGVRFP